MKILIFLLLFVIFLAILHQILLLKELYDNNINIYVISLARSPERKINVNKQLNGINFKYFEAVDGKNLTDNQKELEKKYVEPGSLNPGQIGCLLSHVLLWKQIIQSQMQHTLVLEDDITVVHPFNDIINKLINIKNYDIIYIGHCLQPTQGEMISTIDNINIHESISPLCTHAYLLSYNGAVKLLEYFNNHLADGPVDNIIVRMIDNKLLNSYSLYPTLIDQNGTPSTIMV